MAEQWYAIHNAQTGQLFSIATVIADVLPAGHTAMLLPVAPLANGLLWNATTRTFVGMQPEVLVDRLQDILTNPAYSDFVTAWNALNAAQKTALRNALLRLLGNLRFRGQLDPIELDK